METATAKAKEPQSRADELEERLIDFAVRIIKLSATTAAKCRRPPHSGTDSQIRYIAGAELRRSQRRRESLQILSISCESS